MGFAGASAAPSSPEGVVSQIGQGQIDVAQNLLQTCDTTLAKAAHDPYEARGLIYATLIDADPKIAAAQLQKIRVTQKSAYPNIPRICCHQCGAVHQASCYCY